MMKREAVALYIMFSVRRFLLMKCIQRCQGFQRQLIAGRSNGLHELRARINQDVVDNCQVGKIGTQNQVEPANQGGVFYTASSRIILKPAYSAIGSTEYLLEIKFLAPSLVVRKLLGNLYERC